MKAVHVTAFGGPEVLAEVELPVPEPAPGEVLVRLDAIGINYSDIVTRQGLRAASPPMSAARKVPAPPWNWARAWKAWPWVIWSPSLVPAPELTSNLPWSMRRKSIKLRSA